MQVTVDVTRLEDARTAEAGEVLGRAFFDDPAVIWIFPDEPHRTQVLGSSFAAFVRYGLLFGEVYGTAGALDGSAIWSPPDSGEMTMDRLAAAGLDEAMAQWGDEAAVRFGALMARTEELHKQAMPASHWYLQLLGVDPPRQGIGIGGQLIQPVLARADASGLPCYLETYKARNVPFYQKHGFEVVVEDDIPDGGPHIWTMARRPRA